MSASTQSSGRSRSFNCFLAASVQSRVELFSAGVKGTHLGTRELPAPEHIRGSDTRPSSSAPLSQEDAEAGTATQRPFIYVLECESRVSPRSLAALFAEDLSALRLRGVSLTFALDFWQHLRFLPQPAMKMNLIANINTTIKQIFQWTV